MGLNQLTMRQKKSQGQGISLKGKRLKDFPQVLANCHPTKNGALSFPDLRAGSTKKIWWKCSRNREHNWQANISNVIKARLIYSSSGCPFCAGRHKSQGQGISLKGKRLKEFPQVLASCHPTKNGALNLPDLRAGSGKDIWWKCPRNREHNWRASINNVVKAQVVFGSSGCPFCSGLRVTSANRLDKFAPHLVAEWDFAKNSLTPGQVSYSSSKSVWWKCPKGPDHEWEATVSSRGYHGLGCPFCSNYRVSVTNRLDVVAPFLIPDWDFDRNRPLLPNQVTCGSDLKVWWRCSKGPDHMWQAPIYARVAGRRCPFCSHTRLSVTNTFAALKPELVKQWHPTKNGKLKPNDVAAGAGKHIWWKCPNGPDHEWDAPLYARYAGAGCPFCSPAARRVSVTNSLATHAPHLSNEWHPTKNGTLRPEDFSFHSARKVWWKCPQGPDHEWEATIGGRTGKGARGCPCCSGKKISVTNSLASRFPAVAAQWHPTLNGDLRPDQVVWGSSKKAYFKCVVGHVWKTKIAHRTRERSGCPVCQVAKRKVVMTGRRRESIFMPSYEGVRAGPVKRIR